MTQRGQFRMAFDSFLGGGRARLNREPSASRLCSRAWCNQPPAARLSWWVIRPAAEVALGWQPVFALLAVPTRGFFCASSPRCAKPTARLRFEAVGLLPMPELCAAPLIVWARRIEADEPVWKASERLSPASAGLFLCEVSRFAKPTSRLGVSSTACRRCGCPFPVILLFAGLGQSGGKPLWEGVKQAT